jgi:hypothetical protein
VLIDHISKDTPESLMQTGAVQKYNNLQGAEYLAKTAPLHHRISRRHLPYYLDEFTSRFNRRTSRARGLLFYRLLQQAAATDPHPLAELIGGTGNNWDEPQTTKRQLHSSGYAGHACDSRGREPRHERCATSVPFPGFCSD